MFQKSIKLEKIEYVQRGNGDIHNVESATMASHCSTDKLTKNL